MQLLARLTFYWHGIDADITDYIKRCKICTKHKATQAVQAMLPRDVPDRPWHDLTADFFHVSGKEYLLLADTFNKYSFIYKTLSKTTDFIIQKLQQLISMSQSVTGWTCHRKFQATSLLYKLPSLIRIMHFVLNMLHEHKTTYYTCNCNQHLNKDLP